MLQTLVVVPTLGRRPSYLRESLASIRSGGQARILIVGPTDFDADDLIAEGLADAKVDEVGRGLAAAINQGFDIKP